MRSWTIWNVAILAGGTACANSVACPDGLREVAADCECPEGTARRRTPARDDADDGAHPCVPVSTDGDDGPHEPAAPTAVLDAASAPAARDAGVGIDAGPPSKEGERRDADARPQTLPDAGPPALVPPSAPPPDACTPIIWYRDCDSDGFAASARDAVSACATPAPTTSCASWTTMEPVPGQVDCNDRSVAYRPGADFGVAGDGDGDRNCDGMVERSVLRVTSPRIVENMPASDAPLCGSPAGTGGATCNCFDWYAGGFERFPPCAKAPSDSFTSGYRNLYQRDSVPEGACESSVTFSTGLVDIYELLPICR